jgi:Berberine and berberine like
MATERLIESEKTKRPSGTADGPTNFLVTTVWTDVADTEANVSWTRKFFDAMKPFLADAAYVNYLADVNEEGVRVAYGDKYLRLAALKQKYDPTNFFSGNHNIRPKAAAADAAD